MDTPLPGSEPGTRNRRQRTNGDRLTNALIEMLKVRTIVTIMVIGTISYLEIAGKQPSTAYVAIGTAIITYFFTRKDQKDP